MIDMGGNELECIARGQLANHRSRRALDSSGGDPAAGRQDLLRRFTATPYSRSLQLMQRTIRVETNHRALLDLTQESFGAHQHGRVVKPRFLWRIVCESDPEVQSTALPLSAFSDAGIRYVGVGQRGFFAVDLEARKAVAFLSDRFVERNARLRDRPPLDILFCMTAASLGLTALSAGCVGTGGRGLVVFGPPNSGKTTASYLAAKRGLEFHSDQVVFLDMKHKVLRAWGDPFPAVFRPETVEFLPELRQLSHQSSYAKLSFFYFDKKPMQPRLAHPLTPIGSIFLERAAECDKRLRSVPYDEVVSRLRSYMLFNESPEFDEQVSGAIAALATKQSYSLKYGSDPKIAAAVIEEMLT
jgi:hypothetical protein